MSDTVTLSEAQLYRLLVGPTGGYNAARLAAYAFGRGMEYEAVPGEAGIGYRASTKRRRMPAANRP